MAPVQLYVYDLSNGLARSLSFQLTGKQIDGVWWVIHPTLSCILSATNIILGIRLLLSSERRSITARTTLGLASK